MFAKLRVVGVSKFVVIVEDYVVVLLLIGKISKTC